MSIVTRIVTPSLSDLSPTPTGGTSNPASVIHPNSSSSYQVLQSFSMSGNAFTFVCRFKCNQFTSIDQYQVLLSLIEAAAGSDYAPLINIRDDTNANADERNKLFVQVVNSAGTVIFRTVSQSDVADGLYHTLLFSFDGDNGNATLLIDGTNAIDTGHSLYIAPTTGTLNNSGLYFYLGTLRSTLARIFADGAVSFVGFDDQYITDDSGFFDSNGNPIEQDEAVWANSAWGSQPLIWNKHGTIVDNKGSAVGTSRAYDIAVIV